ncbi:ArsR/SmtB family transcription factor [Streptoalloteichus hindustanus]|uniref:Transcriptional regulator, ArsR family n=1 Tax=Streptoalloteichus hindustanus TaxID=2017 RepID=A0A1M5ET83_STRHI|nr:metalloregulator ArsR/SmtB family transcription factor [Streptoalloteichus hindustanus]SHF82419.1 transcriptional regulator, ArsR family [Streptoalloteichus hindustanus]
MGEFVEEPIYAQLARIGKAIASPVRLRLLDLLDQGECTVEQLAEEAGVSVKNTSAQLQQLRAANLVASRKEGTRVHYRLAAPGVSAFLGQLQDLAEERLADLRRAVADHLGDPTVMEPVTVEELQRRLDDPNLVVLDIRSADEYATGHVPGAISLPSTEIREKLDELPRGAKIVAYCQGPYCVASPKAVRLMRELGYDARPLAGGFTRWHRVGQRARREAE